MGLYTGWPLHMREYNWMYLCPLDAPTNNSCHIAVRDTAGTALYFAEYDVMRHLFGRLPSGEQGPTPSWAPIHVSLVPFACGSFAGVSSWAIIYPLDVLVGLFTPLHAECTESTCRVKTKFQQRALAGETYRGPLTILHRLLRGSLPPPDLPTRDSEFLSSLLV
jgi:solute carrier family 25 carnitine/acylcarnitine transporter 20/29